VLLYLPYIVYVAFILERNCIIDDIGWNLQCMESSLCHVHSHLKDEIKCIFSTHKVTLDYIHRGQGRGLSLSLSLSFFSIFLPFQYSVINKQLYST